MLNLGPIALISNYKLTTSSGKHLEEICYAHIVSLMYKLLTSNKDSDYLSIGFDRSCDRRQQNITNKKYQRQVSYYNLSKIFFWTCRKLRKSHIWSRLQINNDMKY